MSTLTTTRAAVELRDVTRAFGEGPTRVTALSQATLTLPDGELVVVLGPSGSGKTTLLNLIGGIDQPTSGALEVAGQRLGSLDDQDLTAFRRDHVGFVFQFFNLVPTLTARENVALVTELTGRGDPAEVDDILAAVGLADRADHFPGQLSGGEQQRVAIARALAKRPPLLLCDEPTGALDLDTGREVLGLLQRLQRDRGMTVVIVTHNAAIARMAHRTVRMRDGRISDVTATSEPADAATVEW